MTAPKNKPITKEQIELFVKYKNVSGKWRSLEPIFTNHFVHDETIEFCKSRAIKHKDDEAIHLCILLGSMSYSQRLKLVKTI